jgi:Holliday junction resolvasome RuvABC endonuclease subunit
VKVVGIDPASRFTGLAFVVNGVPNRVKVWEPEDKRDSSVKRLEESYRWLYYQLRLIKPDITVVEKMAVFRGNKVIRILSHYEAIALLAAKRHSRIVLNPQVTSARSIVFGKACSKDKAWEEIRKMHPEVEFARKDQGGEDQADALVCALAGEDFAERLR